MAATSSRESSAAETSQVSNLAFDQNLSRAVGWALVAHHDSGDQVDINTAALIFGLAQVEPSRTLLEQGVANRQLFEEYIVNRRQSLHESAPKYTRAGLESLNISVSVQKIMKSADESARNAGSSYLSPVHVLDAALKVPGHREDFTAIGVSAELIRTVTPRALADTATGEDHLDRAIFARALAGLIAVPSTATPLNIGVYGPWGEGKSSLMLQVQSELDQLREIQKTAKDVQTGSVPCLTMRFNAWTFDHQDAVWAGLVTEVLGVYHREVGWWRQVWSYLAINAQQRRLESVAALVVLVLFAAALAFSGWLLAQRPPTVDPSGTESAGSGALIPSPASGHSDTPDWLAILLGATGLSGCASAFLFAREVLPPLGLRLRRYLQRPGYTPKLGLQQEIKAEFERRLDTLLGHRQVLNDERPKRLVIFIDDLDRCRPDSVVEVLEALRVFFDDKGVIVVLGLDEEFVSLAIADRYAHIVAKDENSVTRLQFGRSYLEKIIQVPVYLQKPASEAIWTYARRMFASPSDSQTNESAPAPGSERRSHGRRDGTAQLARGRSDSKVRPGAPSFTALELTTQDADSLVALREALPRNPRQLKRIVNVYRLTHYLMEPLGDFKSGATMAWILLWQEPQSLALAIQEEIRRARSPAQLGAVLGMAPEEANRRCGGTDAHLASLRVLSTVSLQTLATIDRYVSWFTAPPAPEVSQSNPSQRQ
jgi:hypothetical protein